MKNMFTKALSIALSGTIAIIGSASLFTVYATEDDSQNEPILEISTVSVNPGETAKIDVTLKNNPGINGIQFIMSYDEKLSNPEFGNEKLLSSTSALADDSQKLISVVSYSAANIVNDNDGVVFSVSFSISDDAQLGDIYNIEIEELTYMANLKNDTYYEDVTDYSSIGSIFIKYPMQTEQFLFEDNFDNADVQISYNEVNLNYNVYLETSGDGVANILAVSNGIVISSSEVKIAKRGNISLNGEVSSGDLSNISEYINLMVIGKKSELTEFQQFLADVNSDGKVNTQDLALVSEFINKKLIYSDKTDSEIWSSILK